MRGRLYLMKREGELEGFFPFYGSGLFSFPLPLGGSLSTASQRIENRRSTARRRRTLTRWVVGTRYPHQHGAHAIAEPAAMKVKWSDGSQPEFDRWSWLNGIKASVFARPVRSRPRVAG